MIRKTMLALAGLIPSIAARADLEFNMPRGVTELSAETYDLHMMVFWWCVAIGIVVFGAMIWALIRHRKAAGATPARFSHSTTAEIVWTVIPVLILLVMAVPTAETMIRLEDSRDPDLTVVATGYQWFWKYRYQDEDFEFYSRLDADSLRARQLDSTVDPYSVDNYLRNVDKPLVVPVGKKVRLLLTSNDVLHAWWVPDLAIKKDAIPGIVNETWFRAEAVGTYRGQCAELCGKDHGYMPIVVEVVPEDEYLAWVDMQKNEAPRLAAAEQ